MVGAQKMFAKPQPKLDPVPLAWFFQLLIFPNNILPQIQGM